MPIPRTERDGPSFPRFSLDGGLGIGLGFGRPDREKNSPFIEHWTDDPADIEAYHRAEIESWPWFLQKPRSSIETIARTIPETQFVASHPKTREVMAILTAVRINWDGKHESLLPWDRYASKQTSEQGLFDGSLTSSVATSDFQTPHLDKQGNTLIAMSTSVHEKFRGQGVATSLFRALQGEADRLGGLNVLAPVRPSGYGQYLIDNPEINISFADYCELQRPDGSLHDAWLRTVTGLGMRFLRVEPRSTIVHVNRDTFLGYVRAHKGWRDMRDGRLIGDETGSWRIINVAASDDEEAFAEYEESNAWYRWDRTAHQPAVSMSQNDK